MKNVSSEQTPALPRVLLIDDNEANIIAGVALLEVSHYNVDVARNGAEAIYMTTQHPYVAVLMDVNMPDFNGTEATQRIREFEKVHGRPHAYIIGMTAYSAAYAAENCRKAGMDGFISKPIDLKRLQEQLAVACQRQSH